MIKCWSNFNESNSNEVDNFKSEVEKIREYFIEFEDTNSITYEVMVISKSESSIGWCINPRSGNFDKWSESISLEANRYLTNEDYRKLFLNSQLSEYPFCFCANIKLKGEKDEKHFGSNCIISEQGVNMLEDVLVAYKRLKDNYDKITMDMNSNHSSYKPLMLKIYFNPIGETVD
jgi:hypothetical protein